MALAKWMKKYKKEVEFPSKEESKHHRRHSSYHPKNKCHVPTKIQQNKNRIRKGSGTTSEEESIEIESDEKVRENNTNIEKFLTKYCVVILTSIFDAEHFLFFFKHSPKCDDLAKNPLSDSSEEAIEAIDEVSEHMTNVIKTCQRRMSSDGNPKRDQNFSREFFRKIAYFDL